MLGLASPMFLTYLSISQVLEAAVKSSQNTSNEYRIVHDR